VRPSFRIGKKLQLSLTEALAHAGHGMVPSLSAAAYLKLTDSHPSTLVNCVKIEERMAAPIASFLLRGASVIVHPFDVHPGLCIPYGVHP